MRYSLPLRTHQFYISLIPIKSSMYTNTSNDGIGGIANYSIFDPPSQKSVLSTMFLSRLITSAEKNYWPTELDIADLC